jgi:hypothetical protein
VTATRRATRWALVAALPALSACRPIYYPSLTPRGESAQLAPIFEEEVSVEPIGGDSVALIFELEADTVVPLVPLCGRPNDLTDLLRDAALATLDDGTVVLVALSPISALERLDAQTVPVLREAPDTSEALRGALSCSAAALIPFQYALEATPERSERFIGGALAVMAFFVVLMEEAFR